MYNMDRYLLVDDQNLKNMVSQGEKTSGKDEGLLTVLRQFVYLLLTSYKLCLGQHDNDTGKQRYWKRAH